jgi:hypothetical protein
MIGAQRGFFTTENARPPEVFRADCSRNKFAQRAAKRPRA